MIYATKSELEIITDIIERHAPHCVVFVFGSRYRGNHKKYSDLDLAFMLPNKERLGLKRIGQLEYAFMESNLPYRVDVLDYNAISPEFRAVIDAGNSVLLFPKT